MTAPAGERDQQLDGLRGFAALLVVASHASNLKIDLVPGWSLSGIGKYGVYLFFVLSAFLLTAQWLRARESGRVSRRYLLVYLARRVLRIYPLYALVLLAGWALAPRGLGVRLDGTAVWQHLSLQDGQDIYWSVPVEFLYYLVIPPLALWLGSALPALWRGAGALAALGAAMLAYPPGAAPLNSINLGYYLPVFLCGSLAAWALHRPAQDAARPAPRPLFDALAVLGLLLSVPSVSAVLGWGAGPDALHRAFLGWGVFWSVLLVALLSGRLPVWRRVMCLPGLRACGRWCFGIYLLPMPALYLARQLPLPLVLKGWLGLALALALAALAFRCVEQPAIRLGQRLRAF